MRIFVADAGRDFRLAVQLLINQQPGMNVIGIAIRADGLVEQVVAAKPDLLLVNWDLPGQSLALKLAYLRTRLPGLKLIIMCVRPESKTAAQEAGYDTVIDLSMAPKDLLQTIRNVGAANTERADARR